MGLPREAAPPQVSIRVSSQELERILKARKNLDDIKALAQYAAQYQNLGWNPVALEAQTGLDLGVDFTQPQTAWLKLLMDLALQDAKVRLAIRLEPHSQLFVLRVKPAPARAILDRLGNWRSPCIARAGEVWEHHFLMLPQSWRLSPGRLAGDRETYLSVMGPGELVAVPPSADFSGQETWRWLYPPWEQPPWHPDPGLLIFLENCGFISRQGLAAGEAGAEGSFSPSPLRERLKSEGAPPSLENLADKLYFLAARTTELEQQLHKLTGSAGLPPPGAGDRPSSCRLEQGASFSGWQEWLNLMPQRPPEGLEDLRRAVEEFLAANRDLSDSDGVQLLYYCYRNYIAIDPAYTGLSYGEKLCRAGELARNFLKSCP